MNECLFHFQSCHLPITLLKTWFIWTVGFVLFAGMHRIKCISDECQDVFTMHTLRKLLRPNVIALILRRMQQVWLHIRVIYLVDESLTCKHDMLCYGVLFRMNCDVQSWTTWSRVHSVTSPWSLKTTTSAYSAARTRSVWKNRAG